MDRFFNIMGIILIAAFGVGMIVIIYVTTKEYIDDKAKKKANQEAYIETQDEEAVDTATY